MGALKKVLIANRGEIAVRILRCAHERGMKAVAVYSEADEAALHVQLADEAVLLGPPEPRASYLDIPKVIDAAVSTDCDCVHPGYGFLSENAAFARACSEAGLVFVGPPAEVIDSLGDKTRARAMMEAAGVPVLPGTPPLQECSEAVQEQARAIGYPVLVKAAAGGGGKGMRVVADPAALRDALEASSREAAGAFGDGRVFLEKLLVRPRHVEFQILADVHGNVLHLFERECSIQRRHQKILEESPCAALEPELRERMGRSAVDAARAAGYVNAGTVEFLLAADGAFYFLEVNTRIQVEHPITEMVTGVDLVHCQFDVAEGTPLPFAQEALSQRGHAMECRIYAEDPANGFLPSTGRIVGLSEPSGPGVRVDTGIHDGSEVSIYYDPMLAKLTVHGADREACRLRLLAALREYRVLGVKTNVPYMIALAAHPEFAAGRTHTAFLQEHLSGPQPPSRTHRDAALVAAALAAFRASGEARGTRAGSGDEARRSGVWSSLGHWRMGVPGARP